MSLAIIDGDVLAYKACKFRGMDAHEETATTITFKVVPGENHRERVFTPEQDAQYLMESWDNFKRHVQETIEECFATDFVMAVKGPDNYRSELYPEYKAGRGNDGGRRNEFVPIIRKLAVKEGLALEATGREADDWLRIWANEAAAAGIVYTVCSIDKDLKCIPGRHYLMHKDQHIVVTPEEATRFYYEQILQGDPTDNIPGIPNVGPKKAAKMLKDCSTESEMQQEVIRQYFAAYKSTYWREYLLTNGKMIHLQRTPDDYFNLREWSFPPELGISN